MQKPSKKYYTPEEYLIREEAAAYKSNYHHGEIFDFSGASFNHSQIISNIHFALRQKRMNFNCRVAMNDLRVWIEAQQSFVYPDIVLICDKPQFLENRDDTILNPKLIIEVLSDSTKDYDRGEKFVAYRAIPSFREYILVDQYKRHVEQFHLGHEGKWILTEYDDPAAMVKCESIPFRISMNEIYEQIEFR